jgi:hypothetical protein
MELLNFKSFLTESISNGVEGLTDVAHLPLYFNNDGVGHAATVLDDVHNHLLGKKVNAEFTTPYHGSPQIEFGHKRDKFYAKVVGGNVNEGVEDSLQHLQKIMPREGGEYSGVVMHSKGSTTRKNNMISTTPAGVTYSVSPESAEGKKIKNSHIGVIIDKKRVGNKQQILTDKDRKKFKDHPDVDNIDPSVKSNPLNYTPEEQTAFMTHYKNAHIAYTGMKPESLDMVAPHAQHIHNHLEKMKNTDQEPNADSYIADLSGQQKAEVSKGLNLGAKDSSTQKHAERIKDAFHNKNHIDKAIKYA